MATKILITVGKNELPCLISAHRLVRHYRDKKSEPKVVFVCTKAGDTLPLSRALGSKLPTVDIQNLEIEDPFDPGTIDKHVLASTLLTRDDDFHLNYTGGTKAMGLHTYQALCRRFPNAKIELSYLAPDKHQLRTRGGAIIASDQLVDERADWRELTIETLGALRGFEKPECTKVDDELITLSVSFVTEWLPFAGADIGWLTNWNKSRNNRSQPFEWYPNWLRCTPELQRYPAWTKFFEKPTTGGSPWLIRKDLSGSTDAIERLSKFLNNEALEIVAFQALKNALNGSDRVYHSIKFKTMLNPVRDFEIDALALLGYQALAVSCSMTKKTKEIKLKAFEILHRARQFGGDQARMLVVAPLSDNQITLLETDINADLGGADQSESSLPAVQIFGLSSLTNHGQFHIRKLSAKFSEYIFNQAKWS